ncbi:hypothetical protein RHMOL_Rhmol08G0183300 [Rhododendron molle]|uniref:Uncharacterized protein n=1 Tax=Rhododendron molle TaxID=49168 RepID=A0ACC0MQ02_RHOML|nr:hypothetical protein RHMOL_Rhmol08G0183300 [Rhododendron molle]
MLWGLGRGVSCRSLTAACGRCWVALICLTARLLKEDLDEVLASAGCRCWMAPVWFNNERGQRLLLGVGGGVGGRSRGVWRWRQRWSWVKILGDGCDGNLGVM